jgi:NAD(P)-dependent dehydrogenase (short-subunit alcohol dehydrogenase family)
LGTVPIGGSGWYEQTAGVCEFPADPALTAEELTDLGSQPIAVRRRGPDHASPAASEGANGVHVRADDFVYRISANETVIAVAGPAVERDPVVDVLECNAPADSCKRTLANRRGVGLSLD